MDQRALDHDTAWCSDVDAISRRASNLRALEKPAVGRAVHDHGVEGPVLTIHDEIPHGHERMRNPQDRGRRRTQNGGPRLLCPDQDALGTRPAAHRPHGFAVRAGPQHHLVARCRHGECVGYASERVLRAAIAASARRDVQGCCTGW